MVENNQTRLMKKGEAIDRKLEAKKGSEKMPKWKAESLAFRAGLKQNKNGPLTQEDKNIIQQSKEAEQSSMVKCPYCGRTFNETAGARHITFCAGQQKKLGNNKKR